MDVTASIDAAREQAQEHFATFTRRVEEAVVRELPMGVNRFLAALGGHVDLLATECAATLERHTAPWTAEGEGERLRARFAREARLSFAPVLAYSKGYVDGGSSGSSADLVVALVSAWAEPALAAWFDRVIEDFTAAGIGASTVSRASAAAPRTTGPSPTGQALELSALLARAEQLGIRIKNVPEAPTQRYLEKLAESLEERARKAPPPAAAAPGRLETLLAFAEELKVRVKAVPEAPSESWLSKMEEKLREVAERKGTPIPVALGGGTSRATAPPPADTPMAATPMAASPRPEPADSDGTPMWAPERATVPAGGSETGIEVLPPPSPEEEAERRVRVEALLEKAAEAALELGRIPSAPSDAWIAETEARLEAAIEKKKAERKAERKRKENERKARIQLVQEKARRLGVDLGPLPPFPTDDWLARAELRIQAELLGPTNAAVGDTGRGERLRKLVVDADASGIDLGEVPPDPDDEWLEWAEGQLQQQESEAEGALALISEGLEAVTAALVYEEGTVQEQSWTLEADQPVTIGRGRGNTVHVRDDAGISRQHLTLWTEGGRYYLRDEGSTKGTTVEGRRVEGELELRGDEVIVASETRFVFRLR
jgi:hypothetical protein